MHRVLAMLKVKVSIMILGTLGFSLSRKVRYCSLVLLDMHWRVEMESEYEFVHLHPGRREIKIRLERS